jgi:deazaflavin-dependent oxidoreductase (nitroreductase family)
VSLPGIPRFEPPANPGLAYRWYAAFIRSPAGRFIAMKVATRVDPVLLRISGGRVSMALMLPSANLTTTGAKSGEPRTVTILYFSDGDDVILIASSFGREKHPAWYYNLKAHPEAVLEKRGKHSTYRATEVAGDSERQRLFTQADLVYPGYADYRVRTAAVGREIPILRLQLVG